MKSDLRWIINVNSNYRGEVTSHLEGSGLESQNIIFPTLQKRYVLHTTSKRFYGELQYKIKRKQNIYTKKYRILKFK